MMKVEFSFFAVAALIFLLLCYELNLLRFFIVMVPICLVCYLLNENKDVMLKQVNHPTMNMKKEKKQEDIELTQSLLNI